MVTGFQMQDLGVAPSLNSRHTKGFGIDMTIAWTGTLPIADADGQIVDIVALPRSGLHSALERIGEGYGVIKYNRSGRDDPHWSDNGA